MFHQGIKPQGHGPDCVVSVGGGNLVTRHPDIPPEMTVDNVSVLHRGLQRGVYRQTVCKLSLVTFTLPIAGTNVYHFIIIIAGISTYVNLSI